MDPNTPPRVVEALVAGHFEFTDFKKSVWIALLLNLLFRGPLLADWNGMQIEKKMLKYIASDAFGTFQADQRCRGQGRYRVYLIDDFEQDVDIVPEIRTSHGEMLSRLLQSGRNDIAVTTFNTALSKGLAQIIDQLRNGTCIDAIIVYG